MTRQISVIHHYLPLQLYIIYYYFKFTMRLDVNITTERCCYDFAEKMWTSSINEILLNIRNILSVYLHQSNIYFSMIQFSFEHISIIPRWTSPIALSILPSTCQYHRKWYSIFCTLWYVILLQFFKLSLMCIMEDWERSSHLENVLTNNAEMK